MGICWLMEVVSFVLPICRAVPSVRLILSASTAFRVIISTAALSNVRGALKSKAASSAGILNIATYAILATMLRMALVGAVPMLYKAVSAASQAAYAYPAMETIPSAKTPVERYQLRVVSFNNFHS
jgi:hypothetical protein